MAGTEMAVKHSQFDDYSTLQYDLACGMMYGPRPLVFLGLCDGADDEVAHIYDMMKRLAEDIPIAYDEGKAVPFAIPVQFKDTVAAPFGIASADWMIGLVEWVLLNAPERHRNQIFGLLAGDSIQNITRVDCEHFHRTNPPEATPDLGRGMPYTAEVYLPRGRTSPPYAYSQSHGIDTDRVSRTSDPGGV